MTEERAKGKETRTGRRFETEARPSPRAGENEGSDFFRDRARFFRRGFRSGAERAAKRKQAKEEEEDEDTRPEEEDTNKETDGGGGGGGGGGGDEQGFDLIGPVSTSVFKAGAARC